MNNSVGINVRVSLKDLRKMSFAYEYKGILKKIGLIFSLIIGAFIIIAFISLTVAFLLDENLRRYVLWLPLSLISLPFFVLMPNISVFITYSNTKKILKMRGALDVLERYEFTSDGFTVTSSKNSYHISWDYVTKVIELKSCFLIQVSRVNCYVIPKRCFKDGEELNDFFDFLFSVLDRKKLKVKKYRFDEFSPDHGEVVFHSAVVAEEKEKTEERETTDKNTPIIEISFINAKDKLLKANFIICYRMPILIICTLLSPLCIYRIINPVVRSIGGYVILFLPIVFAVLVPVFSYLNIRNLEKNSFFEKEYTFKFYDKGFEVIYPNGTQL